MTSFYAFLLRLYPAEYRRLFGSEMVAVYARTQAEHRQRGWQALLVYRAREFGGVLAALVREWIARAASGGQYLVTAAPAIATGAHPTEIERCRAQVDALVQKMVHAIAHHDFEGARRYSNEERRERERLQRLTESRTTRL